MSCNLLFSLHYIRHTFQADPLHAVFHPELEAKKTMEAINIFAENLYQSDKGSRISTLRILSHYEPLNCELSVKSEDSQSCHTDTQRSDVCISISLFMVLCCQFYLADLIFVSLSYVGCMRHGF